MSPFVLPLLMSYALVELVTKGRITLFLIREVLRLFVLLELFAMKLVRLAFPPRFKLVGECHKSGTCCQQILGSPPDFVRRSPTLLSLFAGYHKLAHNFSVVGRGPDGELVFSCGHLRTDGRCGIYRYRPLLCRDYPLQPFFTAPRILPGCGFKLTPREVAKMTRRASLPIVNPGVTVHHPTRAHRGHDQPEDFEWVDDS